MPNPETATLSTVEIVRHRLANGRTIADSDVHRLVSVIDRMSTAIRQIAEMSPKPGGVGQIARDEMRRWGNQ